MVFVPRPNVKLSGFLLIFVKSAEFSKPKSPKTNVYGLSTSWGSYTLTLTVAESLPALFEIVAVITASPELTPVMTPSFTVATDSLLEDHSTVLDSWFVTIGVIVIDLPFVIAKRNLVSKEGSNVMINRFSSFYPTDELFENYYHWIKEAYRVLKPDGILVFKCQATITSARQLMTPEYSWMMATACGFYTLDQFFLLAKNRLHSGKIKKQQHARKFTSTLYVFKKTDKKKIKYLDFMNEETEGNFINSLIHNMTNSKN